MIISANRLSSINGRYTIGVNENYGSEDLGRILMEDTMNDMAIFNAAVMCDMHEIKARQEGTMLESEIQAMTENAVTDFCKKIVDKLKSFWAKMQGWFKSAIANISAYVVRNGNAFVKMHLKDISNLSDDAKCGNRWIPDGGGFNRYNADVKGLINSDWINQKAINKVSDKSATELKSEMLAEIASGDNFLQAVKEKYYKEVKECTIGKFGKTRAMDTLKGGKDSIKSMKSLENDLGNVVKKVIQTAQNTAKESLNDVKDDEERKKKAQARVDYLKSLSTAVTAVCSTVAKTGVKLVKFDLAECRKALAAAIGTTAKQESTLLESLLLEADDEIAELNDSDYASDLTPEEEEAVDAIVDAIEEKLSDGESGSDDE